MRLLNNSRGTSVVEILVVMVVLLVGIMSAIRLFPPGFASVRYAENMTFAGRLGQFEVERWKNNVHNLPEGILPIDDAGNILYATYPGPPVDDENSGCFRRVIGETTRIPFGGWSTGPESGSLYILSFSPVDTRPGHQIEVRGGDLSRRTFDSDVSAEPWNFLRPHQYGIDYGGQSEKPKICFRRDSRDRVFHVTISWWEQGGTAPELRTDTSITIQVQADFGGWIEIPISSGTGFMGVDHYSETVSRGFVELPYGSSWSSDPYEFQVIDGTLGIIEFNPLGYAQREFGRPLEARLDYDILDLEIIREDKRIPTTPVNGTLNVNLTLRHLKQNGITQDIEGNPYEGLYTNVLTDDIIAVDLETCRVIDLGASVESVNYKDGIVTFWDTLGFVGGGSVRAAGRNVRFFYKAEGDWSVQFHKAYAMYEREDEDVPLTYKSYFVGPASGNGDPNRIWFAMCNANSTVSVDYEYVDADGNVKKVLGESHKCSDVQGIQGSGGVDSTFIDLKWKPTRIFAVRGISARSRVIWRDSERWRYVDLDTTMVRKPAA